MWREETHHQPLSNRPANTRQLEAPHTCPGRCAFRVAAILPLVVLLSLTTGCRTPVSFAPVNLKQPGWTVRQGQAIWQRKPGGKGIAGELLVATRPDGRAFVQFSKSPFPLVIAQSTPEAWSVEFPPQNKHYSGHGLPPARIIFLYLPRALSGLRLPTHWSWQQLSPNGWRLVNHASGESLEVYFNQ